MQLIEKRRFFNNECVYVVLWYMSSGNDKTNVMTFNPRGYQGWFSNTKRFCFVHRAWTINFFLVKVETFIYICIYVCIVTIFRFILTINEIWYLFSIMYIYSIAFKINACLSLWQIDIVSCKIIVILLLLILIRFWDVFDVYANWFFSQNITVDQNLMNKQIKKINRMTFYCRFLYALVKLYFTWFSRRVSNKKQKISKHLAECLIWNQCPKLTCIYYS